MLQVRFAFFAVVFETVSALRNSLFNFKGCCWWDNFCKQNLFHRRWSHGRNFRCFTQITCGESRHEIWEVSNRHLKDITDNPTPYFVLHNVSKAFWAVNNKILVPCSFKLKRLNNNNYKERTISWLNIHRKTTLTRNYNIRPQKNETKLHSENSCNSARYIIHLIKTRWCTKYSTSNV